MIMGGKMDAAPFQVCYYIVHGIMFYMKSKLLNLPASFLPGGCKKVDPKYISGAG